jgi:hypothetical protein
MFDSFKFCINAQGVGFLSYSHIQYFRFFLVKTASYKEYKELYLLKAKSFQPTGIVCTAGVYNFMYFIVGFFRHLMFHDSMTIQM